MSERAGMCWYRLRGFGKPPVGSSSLPVGSDPFNCRTTARTEAGPSLGPRRREFSTAPALRNGRRGAAWCGAERGPVHGVLVGVCRAPIDPAVKFLPTHETVALSRGAG